MTSYSLASASGLTFAFYFFLTFSAAAAFLIYSLLTRPSARRTELGLGTVRKAVAVPFALLVWIGLFSAIYWSSLAGFHTLTIDDAGVRVDYAMPQRSIAVPYVEITDVLRRPAYKGQWRLEILTRSRTRLTSAPGPSRQITDAAGAVERLRRR